MTLIDRYILRRFAVSYLGCLASLMLLYVVLDIFTKLDEFTVDVLPAQAQAAQVSGGKPTAATEPAKKTKVRASLGTFLRNVGSFYAYRVPVIFDLINGLVVLMAATFTLGWLEKQNELLPLLAAGVRWRRIFLPAWLMTVAGLAVGVANRELLIPRLAEQIVRKAEDPLGTKPIMITGGFDKSGVHFDGKAAYADRQLIMQGRVTLPPEGSAGLIHLACHEMYYQAPTDKTAGGWWLNGCRPEKLPILPAAMVEGQAGQFFIRTDLDFERLTRRANWFLYQSTTDLMRLVEEDDQCPRRPEVITALHSRITHPMTELLVVMLGIPLLVGCPHRSIYIKVGSILGLFALAQAVDLTCAGLARTEYLDPSLAAWLPVLVFGPWSLVASDGG